MDKRTLEILKGKVTNLKMITLKKLALLRELEETLEHALTKEDTECVTLERQGD